MAPRRRRSRLEIMVDILEAISRGGGARATWIMYEANMPYDRLKRYLSELLEKGLVRRVESGGESRYYITDKGLELVREYRRIKRLAEALGIDI